VFVWEYIDNSTYNNSYDRFKVLIIVSLFTVSYTIYSQTNTSSNESITIEAK